MKRLLTIALLCLASTITRAADRPNIVWLVSEDNSKHFLKLFDKNGAQTPEIAKLAEHGLIFEHVFSNAPVCSVARTTLATGCYGPRIGTQYHRRSVTVPMPDGLRMFPAYLRDAGYYTTNNSKKDYNAIEGKGVWDASSNKANWRGRKEGQPFFHMQSFGTSHESSLHFSVATIANTKTANDPETVFIPPIHPKTATFKYTYARYHDRIQQIDQQIGHVVKQLESDGLLDDTFIFYFGDHGGVLPGSKGYAYETGLHVPLVVRVPTNFKHLADRELNTRVKGFVSFIDFGPTALHLAGVDVPKQMDGRPFLGKGLATEVDARDEVYCYADRFDAKFDLVRTLRKGKFKYMRSYQPFNFDGLHNNYRYRMLAYAEWRDLYHAGKLDAAQSIHYRSRDAEALYDLESDPYETKNLANNPKYADTVADLRGRLSNRVKSLPDLSLFPESHLVSHAFGNPAKFGESHRDQIAKLADVADLSLGSFKDAESGIAAALESTDPWERYWALIACTTHGKAAESFVGKAQSIASGDDNGLVRVRAAEFLGLTGKGDPRPTIKDVLAGSESGVQTNLILNTVVLLQDGKPSYDFKLTNADLHEKARNDSSVKRRMSYLTGQPEPAKRPKKKKQKK